MIRDLASEEFPAAAHLAAASFREDPGFCHLIPDDATRRHRLPSLIEALLRVDAASGGRIRGAFDEDALVGVSAGVPSGSTVPGLLSWLRRGRGLAWLMRDPAALLRSLALIGAVERLRPPSADYLHLLAVHPATRGRGIGASLLRDSLKGANPLYLETFSPESLAWYEARGFTRLAEVASPVRPTFWTLKRSGLAPG